MLVVTLSSNSVPFNIYSADVHEENQWNPSRVARVDEGARISVITNRGR